MGRRTFCLLLAVSLFFTFRPLQVTIATPVTLIDHENREIQKNVIAIEKDRIILEDGELKRDSIKKIRWTVEEQKTSEITIKPDISKEELQAMAREAAEKFPDAGYITLIDHSIDEYIDSKNQIQTYHGAFIIMNDEYKNLARIASYVDESHFRFEVIYGRIIYPDGTEFYMNPRDLVKSVPQDEGAAFFSTTGSVVYYNFPKPSAGCIVDYKYRHITFLPYVEDMFDSRFTFNGDQPVMQSSLEVIMPADRKLYYVSRNMTAEEETPKVWTENGKTHYLWKLGVQEAIIPEPMMPDMGDIAKQLIYSNHNNLDFLFDWCDRVTGANMKITPLIEKTVDEILKDVPPDPVEITRHLYHWIQREIRYVSIKSGTISNQAGHPAEETLKNKFGDCVDKSVLFATMLRYKGIEAYPLAIRTNTEAEMETRLPVFDANHSITEVILNGRSYFLDPTATSYSFPYFRSDNHGVPYFNATTKKVGRTPVPPPEDNLSSYTREITLDGSGLFTVEFRASYNGPRAAGLRDFYQTVADRDLEKVFQELAKEEAPDADLFHYRVNNKDDLFREFSLEYSFRSREFLKKAGNLFILKNISTLPFSFSEVALPERKYPIEYTTTQRRTNHDTYLLDPRWKIKYVPEPLEIKNPHMYYRAEYLVEGNKIIFRNQYDLLSRIIPVEDYQQYRKDIEKIINYQKENIILEKSPKKLYDDLLILKDGSELEGSLLAFEERGIEFELRSGEVKLYPHHEIISLELASQKGCCELELDRIKDEKLREALDVRIDPAEYPGAEKIILYDSARYTLNSDSTYTVTTRIITKVLTEKGKTAGFDNWNLDEMSEKLVIDHAYSINGSDVTPLSSRTIKTAHVYSDYPEYQRLINTKFAMPEVREGTILDYQVTRTVRLDNFHHPFAAELWRNSGEGATSIDAGFHSSWNPPPAIFWPSETIIKKELVFDVPEGTKIMWKILNNESGTIVSSTKKEKGREIFLFTNDKPMKAVKREEKMPACDRFAPLVLFALKKDWKELYSEVSRYLIPGKEDIEEAKKFIKQFEESKKAPATPEMLYNFIAFEIDVIPVGLRDYDVRPKRIKEILRSGKASYLDAQWLLLNMLLALGKDACLAFMVDSSFSRTIPVDFPSLHYFSSPLIRLKEGEKISYIVAGENYLSMADSSAACEGREVLAVGKNGFLFEKIPFTERNSTQTIIEASMDGEGNLHVEKYISTLGGINQDDYRRLRGIMKEKWPVLANGMVHSIHPAASLEEFEFRNVTGLDGTVEISFKFSVPGFAIKAGNLFFLKPLDLSYSMPEEAVPPERLSAPVDLNLRTISRHSACYRIPEGFSPYYLPEPVHIENDSYLFKASFRFENNLLYYDEDFKIKEPVIEKEFYKEYQRFRKAMADFAEEYVIFEYSRPENKKEEN